MTEEKIKEILVCQEEIQILAAQIRVDMAELKRIEDRVAELIND